MDEAESQTFRLVLFYVFKNSWDLRDSLVFKNSGCYPEDQDWIPAPR